jgi:hypothetical protein
LLLEIWLTSWSSRSGSSFHDVNQISSNKSCGLQSNAAKVHVRGPEVFVRDVLLAGGDGARGVTKADFDAAVEAARKNFADSIGRFFMPLAKSSGLSSGS